MGKPSRAERLLEASRLSILVPVAVLLLAALGAFAYGVAYSVESARQIVDHPFPIGKNMGYFVSLIDIVLVGTTLLISGLGLYELFVIPDRPETSATPLPAWLVIRDLNDLKARVISMIVLVSAVSVIDVVVDLGAGHDVLYLGSGVGALIVALTLFLRFGSRDH